MPAWPRPIVLGNWKMNGLRADGLALAAAIADRAVRPTGTIGIFPPFTILRSVVERIKGQAVMVGAQDCHHEKAGAFTGSVSAAMIADTGATSVLIGHSERRHGLGERDEILNRKAKAALNAGLTVVFCIGETEAEWQAGQRLDVLGQQIDAGLAGQLHADQLILAYEPVWAIGTGRTPTLDEIAATHAFIKERLAAKFAAGVDVPVLYGGSVKPDNAAEILACNAVDGALVGGASLEVSPFWTIYQAGGGA